MTDFNNYNSIFNSIYTYSSRKPESLTFAGWHFRAQAARDAVLRYKKDADAEIDSMKDIWAQRRIDERRAELDRMCGLMRAEGKRRIVDDMNDVLTAKRAAFDRAMGDPGAEAVRLLQVLSMRSTLTPADIAAVVPKLNGNLQSLHVLKELADKNNITFPHLPDAGEIEADFEKLREFADTMANAVDNIDPPYFQRFFWTVDDSIGLLQPVADRLDGLAFLQIDPEEITEKDDQSEGE